MKKAPTAEIKRHWSRVAEAKCIIRNSPQPTLHHCRSGSMTEIIGIRGASLKSSDWLVIPLTWDLHLGKEGIDSGMGVLTWEKEYGTQVSHLDKLCHLLGYNVWEKAGINRTPK